MDGRGWWGTDGCSLSFSELLSSCDESLFSAGMALGPFVSLYKDREPMALNSLNYWADLALADPSPFRQALSKVLDGGRRNEMAQGHSL